MEEILLIVLYFLMNYWLCFCLTMHVLITAIFFYNITYVLLFLCQIIYACMMLTLYDNLFRNILFIYIAYVSSYPSFSFQKVVNLALRLISNHRFVAKVLFLPYFRSRNKRKEVVLLRIGFQNFSFSRNCYLSNKPLYPGKLSG